MTIHSAVLGRGVDYGAQHVGIATAGKVAIGSRGTGAKHKLVATVQVPSRIAGVWRSCKSAAGSPAAGRARLSKGGRK